MNNESPETKNLPGFPECTRPDLILRFLALGVTDKEFEQIAGLHARFISRAKFGAHASAKSSNNWRKFEGALSLCEKAQESGAPLPEPNRMGRPKKSIAGAAEALPDDLQKKIIDARTEEDFCSLLQDITCRTLLPESDPRHIPATPGRVAKELLGEARQTRKQQRAEESESRAGEPVTVEIRNIADWQTPGPCPYCRGTGEIEPTTSS